MNNIWKTNIISLEEFRRLLVSTLVENYKECPLDDFIDIMLKDGFPKFDKDEIGKVMRGLQCRLFLEPVAVDTGNSIFLWLVSGADAIVIKRNPPETA